MDIHANNGSFYLGMFRRFESKCNKADGTISVWSKEKDCLAMVTTYRGDFVEAIDASGNVVAEGGDGDWWTLHIPKKPLTLRFKKLPPLKMTKEQINKKRISVTRYVISDAPYSVNFPDTLPAAIKWMQKHLESIPAASRAKARVRFDTSMSHGESYPNIEISYSELETEKETIKRLKIEAERARLTEIADRAKLAALKEKLADA